MAAVASEYPKGFPNGLISRGVPILQAHPGNVFWVDSSGGSNGNRGTYEKPFSTLDYAIGRCTANNGDIILLKPGHAETVSAASGITADVAGVSIIGMGEGGDRPEFTFSATASTIVISAANVSIVNVVGLPSIDSVVSAFVVQAADCTLDLEWQDASSTVEAVRAILGNASADRLKVKLKYRGNVSGNAVVNAIRLVGSDGADIDIDFYGVASTAVVEFLTTACTNVTVRGYMYNSGTTDGSKNVVDTQGSGTWYADIIDGAAGSRYTGGSAAALASDDVSAIASNVNTVTSAVGHTSGATSSRFGTRVTKVATAASDPDDLFTVTGKCLITLMVGEVTSVIATTTSLSLNTSTNAQVLVASTDVSADALGTLYIVTGDPADGLNGLASGTGIGVDAATITGDGFRPIMINDDKIYMNLDGAGTGLIQWDLWYIPLEASASVASAA